MIDFISTYMPSYLELDPGTVTGTRERLERFIRVGFPDMDLNPNTVVGDLIVTPQAFTLAAIETGMDRFMSDLDLGNVAAGTVYNCDFVERYIGNFGAGRNLSRPASGTVRLLFSENKQYILDRGVRFMFGQAIFSMYMPDPGPVVIYPVGYAAAPGANTAVLRDTGSDSYYADIPVVGNSGPTVVTAGTQGLISVYSIPELHAVTALHDFDTGEETVTVPELARRTRETVYAASLNTRNGAVRYVKTACPFVESVYAIRNGDKEMKRAASYVFSGVTTGAMDVYTRSRSYDFTERQQVRLYLNQAGTFYEGRFPYNGRIYHFESVTHPDLQVDDIPHTIISTCKPSNSLVSTGNGSSIGPSSTYTEYESLWLAVKVGGDAYGGTITPDIDQDGKKYTDFTVTYQTDPMQPAIAATIGNPDNAPVNTGVLARGFIPVVIDRFEVVYTRQDGVVPDLETARDSIKAYIGSLSHEDVFSEAEVARIMDEAGVRYTKGINVRAHVQWSVADLVGSTSNFGIPQDYQDLLKVTDNPVAEEYTGQTYQVTDQVSITDSAGLRVNYPPDGYTSSKFSCTVRNARYFLMKGALTFNEVREV